MNHPLPLLLIIIITISINITSCNKPNQLKQQKQNIAKQNDYVALNDSVFVSKYEVANGAYRAFLKDRKSKVSPAIYRSLLLDSASLRYIKMANVYAKMSHYPGYFAHPAHDDYPVIGITYDQAKQYCAWLTEQERHHSNNDYQIKYRLIHPEEWDAISEGEAFIISKKKDRVTYYLEPAIRDSLNIKGTIYRTNFNCYDAIKFIVKQKIYTIPKKQKDFPVNYQTQPEPIEDYIESEKGLFHLFDNVSEMTSEFGIVKGSNFLSKSTAAKRRNIPYTKAAPWLGFRIVKVISKPHPAQ